MSEKDWYCREYKDDQGNVKSMFWVDKTFTIRKIINEYSITEYDETGAQISETLIGDRSPIGDGARIYIGEKR